MGGSESVFIARPIGSDKYLTLTKAGQTIILGNRDDETGYPSFLFSGHDNSLNIRFYEKSSLYVCVEQSDAGDWAVISKKRSGQSNPAEYKWKLIVVGKRETDGTLPVQWKQEDNYKLDWDSMKKHSLKVVLLNVASKMVLSSGGPSDLSVEQLKFKNGKFIMPEKTVFWEVETVKHCLTTKEKAAAIAGGILGGIAIVGVGVATAGIGLAVLGGVGVAAGAGAGAAAGGSFIAASFIAGEAVAVGGAAAGGAAAAGAGAAAGGLTIGAVLTAGGVVGAVGVFILKKAVETLEKVAVFGLNEIRDDNRGIAIKMDTEEDQLPFIARIIEEAKFE